MGCCLLFYVHCIYGLLTVYYFAYIVFMGCCILFCVHCIYGLLYTIFVRCIYRLDIQCFKHLHRGTYRLCIRYLDSEVKEMLYDDI